MLLSKESTGPRRHAILSMLVAPFLNNMSVSFILVLFFSQASIVSEVVGILDIVTQPLVPTLITIPIAKDAGTKPTSSLL